MVVADPAAVYNESFVKINEDYRLLLHQNSAAGEGPSPPSPLPMPRFSHFSSIRFRFRLDLNLTLCESEHLELGDLIAFLHFFTFFWVPEKSTVYAGNR